MIYPELNNHCDEWCMNGEVWLPVTTHVGYYEVSNYGRVRRLATVTEGKNQSCSFIRKLPRMILKANNDSKGYPQVTLSVGERRVARVHRLVAEAFLPPPSEDILDENLKAGSPCATVNHKDRDINNAHASNLHWCTISYNNAYGYNREERTKDIRGDKNYMALLTEGDVISILKDLDDGVLSQEKIGEKYGVKQITISNINCGRSWAWLTGREWTPRARRNKAKSKQISDR